jgi:putative ABC transport system substrate-binding protein
MAVDLVRRQVKAIAAISPGAAHAAKEATAAIPIVFQSGFDPVDAGLIISLSRPGGNLTGVSRLATDLAGKLLQLVREVAPNPAVIAYLMNPTSPSAGIQTREVEVAARSLRLQQLLLLNASTENEMNAAFATLTQHRVGALAIGQDAFLNNRIDQLAALALRDRIPTIYPLREFATAGGLMSYGASLADQYRLVGVYIGRILHGEKPADLPVQQSTRFELAINLRTAKTLGLTVPSSLLAVADEVIE